jgi:hypothetical protein
VANPRKLLERMRTTLDGWNLSDLVAVYEAHGFVVRHGSKHDVVVHSKYRELRTTLTRGSGSLAKGYVRQLVAMIDLLDDKENGGDRHGG